MLQLKALSLGGGAGGAASKRTQADRGEAAAAAAAAAATDLSAERPPSTLTGSAATQAAGSDA